MADKTEQPSPRRLRQARESGDIPVSAALIHSAALVAAIATLPAVVAWTAWQGELMLQAAFRGNVEDPRALLGPVLALAAPPMAAAAVAAVAVGLAQTGAAFVPSKLTPKLQNLDPLAGLRRSFQLDRLYRVLRALLAAGFVAWLAVDSMLEETRALGNTVGRPESAAELALMLTRKVLWLGALVITAHSVVDVLVTRRSWLKRNRMSKGEVKREQKESEGDPHLKHERKRAHREVLNHAAVLSVKDADVVVVNPTHLATALRYEEEQDAAPVVVAQGQGELARQIVEAARAYGIPVVHDVPMARALRELEVGDEIPEELYQAVAEILKVSMEQKARPMLESGAD